MMLRQVIYILTGAKDGKVNKKTGVTYKGFSSLVGQDATDYNAANGWDIVSSATLYIQRQLNQRLLEMLEGAVRSSTS